jgi:DNA-binding XRE family transcriptional regulator
VQRHRRWKVLAVLEVAIRIARVFEVPLERVFLYEMFEDQI